jgi:hypothetical protein
MFTWIFRTFGIVGLALLMGCQTLPDLAGPLNAAPDHVVVTRDNVTVRGLPGYCVDMRHSKRSADQAFILLVDCGLLQGKAAAVPAILIATIGRAEGGASVAQSFDQLQAFFTSDAGRAALAQSGHFADVELVKTFKTRSVFYVQARDLGSKAMPGGEGDFWRAVMDVGPRLVSLSVLPAPGETLNLALGEALIREFADVMRVANPLRAAGL